MSDLTPSPISESLTPSGQPASDIPSVVAAGQGRSRTRMIGFVAFMAVLAFVVTRSGGPKEPASLPPAETVIAPSSLPPAMALAMSRNRFQSDREFSGLSGRLSAEATLLDVRRKSPMVIFNKNQTTNKGSMRGGTESDESSSLGGTPEGGAPGAPLPQGFNPSPESSSRATSLGDRDTIIAQGKILDAVLETAINSEHPGMTRALVSHDIYGDSGNTILLPRGSRLVGQYDSGVSKGQNRVFVIWLRAIRPDGIDIQLGSAGTDALGRTGIKGNVNYHFMAMFGAATLLSVIGAATSAVGVNPADQNNSLSQYRQNVTSGFNSAAGTVLGQFVQIRPTITIKQGERIKIFIARDLYFDSALLEENGARVVP